MTQEDFVEILNAKGRLDDIVGLNDRFLDYLQECHTRDGAPYRFEFHADGITVECFGHAFKASSHFIRLKNKDFAAEYRFILPFGDENIEIWRFYLRDNGVVYESIQTDKRLCDYQNAYILDYIGISVCLGALRSEIFLETPIPNA